MADRTNPAGEKWKKGRKKKRPLPGTPAQALNEAAGGKTSRLRKEQATGTCTAAAPLEQEETCTLRKEKVPVENGTTPRT